MGSDKTRNTPGDLEAYCLTIASTYLLWDSLEMFHNGFEVNVTKAYLGLAAAASVAGGYLWLAIKGRSGEQVPGQLGPTREPLFSEDYLKKLHHQIIPIYTGKK